jgi:hypothetical protein
VAVLVAAESTDGMSGARNGTPISGMLRRRAAVYGWRGAPRRAHVEAAGGLVEHEQPRLHRERPGDDGPLALAAGHLVGMAARDRGRQADLVEQAQDDGRGAEDSSTSPAPPGIRCDDDGHDARRARCGARAYAVPATKEAT